MMKNIASALFAAFLALVTPALVMAQFFVPPYVNFTSGCSTSYDNWLDSSSATVPGRDATASVSTNALTTGSNKTGSNATGKSGAVTQIVEITMTSGGVAGIGICKAGEATANFPGGQTNCYGYLNSDGKIYHNGSGVTCASSACATYAAGDKIAIAFNGSAWWLAKNGTWQNSATGAEIAAGTTTHAVTTGLSGTWYYVGGSASAAVVTTTNPSMSGSSVTIPTGYCPWNTL